MTDMEHTISILLEVYAYSHAYKIARTLPDFSPKALYLLELLKERRELNVAYAFQHREENRLIEDRHQVKLLLNEAQEEEQIANYLLDLAAKVKNGEIIDFVRSVSPVLYRLFLRLLEQAVPDVQSYIIDTKNDQYDTWNFKAMEKADNDLFRSYLAQRQPRHVTTRSLADLLVLSGLPADIKRLVVVLRQFEKSVRNPLAHLIKPFDEEELYRTTHFSSQAFLDGLISLAAFSGVNYIKEPFYFDVVNAVIEKELSDSAKT